MTTPSDEDAPLRYVIRRSRQAADYVEQEWERLKDLTDEQTADAWQDGLLEAISGLATYPERCAIATEDFLFPNGTLRQLVYQRRRRGPAWRILFSIRLADANDPPIVRVHLIRHGTQAPLTDWPTDDAAS